MTGIIISGHGNFASGLASSLKLIGGEFQKVCYVDFLGTDSIEQLKEKYLIAIDSLKDCKNILALADLVGGSPFKTLVELSVEISSNMQVIGGTNLPMALETLMSRDTTDDLPTLVDIALESGKDNIMKFELLRSEQPVFEDGI